MHDVYLDEEVIRGRPRPEETIRRDELVLSFLKEQPLSRNRIWEKLSETETVSPSQVWLSLDRLRKEGKVKLCQGIGERVWSREVDEPCP